MDSAHRAGRRGLDCYGPDRAATIGLASLISADVNEIGSTRTRVLFSDVDGLRVRSGADTADLIA